MLHMLWIVLIIVTLMGTVVFASDTLFQTRTKETYALCRINWKDNLSLNKDGYTNKEKIKKSLKKRCPSPQYEEGKKQIGPCFWNSIKMKKYEIAEKYKIRIAEADPKYLYSMNFSFPHINSIIREQKAFDDLKPPVLKKVDP